jgi:hypothetical protein
MTSKLPKQEGKVGNGLCLISAGIINTVIDGGLRDESWRTAPAPQASADAERLGALSDGCAHAVTQQWAAARIEQYAREDAIKADVNKELSRQLTMRERLYREQWERGNAAEQECAQLRALLRDVMAEGVEYESPKYALVQMSHCLRRDIDVALAAEDKEQTK